MPTVANLSAVLVVALAACGSSQPTRDSSADRDVAAASIAALQRGDLEGARRTSGEALAADRNNGHAAAVRGVSTWLQAGQAFLADLRRSFERADDRNRFDHAAIRNNLERTLADVLAARADFAIAAADRGLSLPLCPACWNRDWSGDGDIDQRDRHFFEIEFDRAGQPIPKEDPRRRPTYGFDVGDAHWAHAMTSFQAAALEIVLAYDGRATDLLFGKMPPVIDIPLVAPERIARAKKLILAGLASSDASRVAYLAERDDNVEWVPNPSQNNYPMPLPVDAELYVTWEAMVRDVRDLVTGKTGLSIGELSMLQPDMGPFSRPTGYLDIGRMLSKPSSIRLSFPEIIAKLEGAGGDRTRDTDAILRDVFGDYYRAKMTPSPLTKRLLELRNTLAKGGDELERKLMYLLWIN